MKLTITCKLELSLKEVQALRTLIGQLTGDQHKQLKTTDEDLRILGAIYDLLSDEDNE